MEEKLDENTVIRLLFLKSAEFETVGINNTNALQRVQVGETVALAVLAIFCGNRSENENDLELWRSRISRLSVHACLSPRESEVCVQEDPRHPQNAVPGGNGDTAKKCLPCSSFVEGLENQCICDLNLKHGRRFIDNTTWMIPVSLTLNSLPGACDRVVLSLTVWLADKVHPPGTKAFDQLDMIMEPNEAILLDDKTVSSVRFSHCIEVRYPPLVDVTLIPVAGNHTLLLKVWNKYHIPIHLFDCKVLPSSCHWATRSPEDPVCCHKQKPESPVESHDDCVTTTTRLKSEEIILYPCEKFSILYQLRHQGISKLQRFSNLSLAAHLTWSFEPQNQESVKRVITTYFLPRISFRKPPFLVSASCPHVTQQQHSFSVTYDIVNNLQDFLALKLYWSPEKALASSQDKDAQQQVESLVESVLCHDPCVELGSCPKNSAMSVKVGFQVLKPGLYELGTHMKLNLRYALGSHSNQVSPTYSLPSSSVTNSDSNATISAEDQLVVESENLWRDRSSSISSSQSAEPENIPLTAKRRSFATKSYSFGDLGPTGSADSTEDPGKVRFKKIERSSAVPPARQSLALPTLKVPDMPPSTSLMDPANFLKKASLMYVPPY